MKVLHRFLSSKLTMFIMGNFSNSRMFFVLYVYEDGFLKCHINIDLLINIIHLVQWYFRYVWCLWLILIIFILQLLFCANGTVFLKWNNQMLFYYQITVFKRPISKLKGGVTLFPGMLLHHLLPYKSQQLNWCDCTRMAVE